jgi:hypothetical protein
VVSSDAGLPARARRLLEHLLKKGDDALGPSGLIFVIRVAPEVRG